MKREDQRPGSPPIRRPDRARATVAPAQLTHLQRLEAESIHIMREVVAECEKPVMLYSIGKDSAVMLHLAMKAFYPGASRRSRCCTSTRRGSSARCTRSATAWPRELGLELIVHSNPEGVAHGHQPVHARLGGPHRHDEDPGAEAGARQVRLRRRLRRRAPRRGEVARQGAHLLVPHRRSTAGTRRTSAPSSGGSTTRASTRARASACSRSRTGPSSTSGSTSTSRTSRSCRSTSPRERPVVERDGTLIMVDDDRMPLAPGEAPMMRKVRFRTLGCYPLTGADRARRRHAAGDHPGDAADARPPSARAA